MTLKSKEKLANDLKHIIALHDYMKNSYFWNSPSTAYARRSYEKNNSLTSEFAYKNDNYKVVQETSCSCKNVYYGMTIFINGESTNKNIRVIKKILSEVEN